MLLYVCLYFTIIINKLKNCKLRLNNVIVIALCSHSISIKVVYVLLLT